MKYDIDLQKVDEEFLEMLARMQKLGYARQVRDASRREDLIRQLTGTENNHATGETRTRDWSRVPKIPGRGRNDFPALVKKFKEALKEANRPLTATEFWIEAYGQGAGGASITLRKHLLNDPELQAIPYGKNSTRFDFASGEQPAKKKPKFSDAFLEDRRKRMAFIHSRIRTLTKQDTKLQYEHAFRRASAEWNDAQKKHGQTAPANNAFPRFKSVENMTVLRDIVKNAVMGNKPLTYAGDAYALSIENYQDWKDFCQEFISNSSTIARYFGIPNAFHLPIIENKASIAYKKVLKEVTT